MRRWSALAVVFLVVAVPIARAGARTVTPPM
jgi:hypothetical protein